MVARKEEAGVSWKIGEEIVKEVLRSVEATGKVQLEKVAKKAESQLEG